MITVSLNDARNRLPELIEKLGRGEDVVVTHKGRVVAHVTAAAEFEVPASNEDLVAFIQRRRAALGLAASPPAIPDDFDLPTHEDDWLDNPRDPLNEGRLGA